VKARRGPGRLAWPAPDGRVSLAVVPWILVMKLYSAPGACSLASRISLHEAGIAADFERVDMKTKIAEHGFDYKAINSKGSGMDNFTSSARIQR